MWICWFKQHKPQSDELPTTDQAPHTEEKLGSHESPGGPLASTQEVVPM